LRIVARTNKTTESVALWDRSVTLRPELPRLTGKFFAAYFRYCGRSFPWRDSHRPFRLLVAEILLQKTHRRVVARVWEEIFSRWPTPRLIVAAGPSSIQAVMKPLGIAKRSKRLRDLAKAICQRGGRTPKKLSELTALPGVGNYTAASVLCQAFGKQISMIDVNAGRVYTRLYGVEAKTLRQKLAFAELAANAAITFADAREINLGVLDFSDAVCRSSPLCAQCPLLNLCAFGKKLKSERSAGGTGPLDRRRRLTAVVDKLVKGQRRRSIPASSHRRPTDRTAGWRT